MATLLRERGGLRPYAAEMMATLNWAPEFNPGRGDVGLVMMPGMGLTCAICLGSTWMAKGPHRVLIIRAPHEAAWSVRECLKPLPQPL